jgi:hypothetical protein
VGQKAARAQRLFESGRRRHWRKLTVAIWYLMMGRWTPLEEIDARIALKIGKIMTQVGAGNLKKLGKTRKQFREQIYDSLKAGRTYLLDAQRKFMPKPTLSLKPTTLAQEYGLE